VSWRRKVSASWRTTWGTLAGGCRISKSATGANSGGPYAGPYGPYHALQDQAIRSTPSYPTGRFDGAGIVVVAGGPRYFTNAWVLITVLRRALGCRLPIELWYLGAAELSPRMIELLAPFEVECVNALEVRRRHPVRTLGGWECKPYAIVHSRFKDVILLDADNVPLIDPAGLLASRQFRETGALFWPDVQRRGAEHPVWQICRVPYRDAPELESGQLVVDKARCWRALHLTMHLNEWSRFYYRHTQGDKGTFEMAWRMLDQPFSMPASPPIQVQAPVPAGVPSHASVLLQHDFDGNVIFQHRTGGTEKWTAWGENVRFPGFRYEELCLDSLRELRRQWDGYVDLAPALLHDPGPEGEIVRARHFLYRRVGSDDQVLNLLPGGRTGEPRDATT
jgi:hypothetical protein